jgi:hypothetical protein
MCQLSLGQATQTGDFVPAQKAARTETSGQKLVDGQSRIERGGRAREGIGARCGLSGRIVSRVVLALFLEDQVKSAGALRDLMQMRFEDIFAEKPGHTFTPVSTPVLVRPDAILRSGNQRLVYSGELLPNDFKILGRKIGALVGKTLEVERLPAGTLLPMMGGKLPVEALEIEKL